MSHVKSFHSALLSGHEQQMASNSDVMVSLKEVCKRSQYGSIPGFAQPCKCIMCSKKSTSQYEHATHVPYSVACLLQGIVDTVVYVNGEDRELPLRGWACRQTNVRPSHRHPQVVVEKLRECFDAKTRMSAHVIGMHLVEHFGKYAGPRFCLRSAQISGWISSEVSRRKKACVSDALFDASVGVVEAADVGPEKSKAAPKKSKAAPQKSKAAPIEIVEDLVEGLELNETLGALKGESTDDFVARQRCLWRKLRPAPAVVAGPSLKAQKVVAVKRAKAPPVVSEVVNKRGRRCMWEYECRWVGLGADETTWEAVDDLKSLAASQAIKVFEAAMQRQSKPSLSCLGKNPIRAECCNTIVESETYDEAKGKCRDMAACLARRHKMCAQPASKRVRVSKQR